MKSRGDVEMDTLAAETHQHEYLRQRERGEAGGDLAVVQVELQEPVDLASVLITSRDQSTLAHYLGHHVREAGGQDDPAPVAGQARQPGARGGHLYHDIFSIETDVTAVSPGTCPGGRAAGGRPARSRPPARPARTPVRSSGSCPGLVTWCDHLQDQETLLHGDNTWYPVLVHFSCRDGPHIIKDSPESFFKY